MFIKIYYAAYGSKLEFLNKIETNKYFKTAKEQLKIVFKEDSDCTIQSNCLLLKKENFHIDFNKLFDSEIVLLGDIEKEEALKRAIDTLVQNKKNYCSLIFNVTFNEREQLDAKKFISYAKSLGIRTIGNNKS